MADQEFYKIFGDIEEKINSIAETAFSSNGIDKERFKLEKTSILKAEQISKSLSLNVSDIIQGELGELLKSGEDTGINKKILEALEKQIDLLSKTDKEGAKEDGKKLKLMIELVKGQFNTNKKEKKIGLLNKGKEKAKGVLGFDKNEKVTKSGIAKTAAISATKGLLQVLSVGTGAPIFNTIGSKIGNIGSDKIKTINREKEEEFSLAEKLFKISENTSASEKELTSSGNKENAQPDDILKTENVLPSSDNAQPDDILKTENVLPSSDNTENILNEIAKNTKETVKRLKELDKNDDRNFRFKQNEDAEDDLKRKKETKKDSIFNKKDKDEGGSEEKEKKGSFFSDILSGSGLSSLFGGAAGAGIATAIAGTLATVLPGLLVTAVGGLSFMVGDMINEKLLMNKDGTSKIVEGVSGSSDEFKKNYNYQDIETLYKEGNKKKSTEEIQETIKTLRNMAARAEKDARSGWTGSVNMDEQATLDDINNKIKVLQKRQGTIRKESLIKKDTTEETAAVTQGVSSKRNEQINSNLNAKTVETKKSLTVNQHNEMVQDNNNPINDAKEKSIKDYSVSDAAIMAETEQKRKQEEDAQQAKTQSVIIQSSQQRPPSTDTINQTKLPSVKTGDDSFITEVFNFY